jgi:hypothetical protein
VIKSRRIGWIKCVAGMEETRNVIKILVRIPEERSLGIPNVDGRVTFNHILKKQGFNSSGPGYGPISDCCEHGNGHSNYIKGIAIMILLHKKIKVKLSLCFN